MNKDHLSLIKSGKIEKESVKKQEKKFLVTEGAFTHLENDFIKLENFSATPYYSKFSFSILLNGKKEKIAYDMELIDDTILFEIKGEKLTEELRIIASKLYEKITESLRFIHKDKEWALSHYFILDFKAYEERKDPNFAINLKDKWMKMKKEAKYEGLDETTYLFFEMEEIRELKLRIIGEDGFHLCKTLKELKIADYKPIGPSEYEIFPFNEDKINEVNLKIYYARTIAKFGYNIWVDYVEKR